MNKTIRRTLLAGVPLLAVAVLAAARNPNGTPPGSRHPAAKACRGQVGAAASGKLPALQAGEDFSCVADVASRLQSPAETITQAFVPADSGCSSDQRGHPNSTAITVTAFNNSGNLDFNADFRQLDGVIVAQVVNNSNCATRGIRLAPHHTYFWVVEHGGRDARLVSADNEIKLSHFTSCRTEGFPDASGRAAQSVAMIKVKGADPRQAQCDHQRAPGARHFGMPGASGGDIFHMVSARRPTQRGDSWVLWMGCAADCCYAEI